MKVIYYINGYKKVWQTKIIQHLAKLTCNRFMKTDYILEIVHIWLQESLATRPPQNKLNFSVTDKFEKWLHNSLKVIYYINGYKSFWQTKIIWHLAKLLGNCFQKTFYILESVHIRLQESLAINLPTQVKFFSNWSKMLQHRIHTFSKRKIYCTRNTKPFICSKIQHALPLALYGGTKLPVYLLLYTIILYVDEDLFLWFTINSSRICQSSSAFDLLIPWDSTVSRYWEEKKNLR